MEFFGSLHILIFVLRDENSEVEATIHYIFLLWHFLFYNSVRLFQSYLQLIYVTLTKLRGWHIFKVGMIYYR